jgi:hypothetical protein
MAAMAARLALADPALALPHGRVAAAREVACSAAEQVCGVAHAVHGAIGVTAEYDLQLFTRRLKGWAAEFGSSRYWASRLGRGAGQRRASGLGSGGGADTGLRPRPAPVGNIQPDSAGGNDRLRALRTPRARGPR